MSKRGPRKWVTQRVNVGLDEKLANALEKYMQDNGIKYAGEAARRIIFEYLKERGYL